MRAVTGIEWAITTGNHWWSGTDSRVDIEIYRDNFLIDRRMLEPGNDPERLTRGETERYAWTFVVLNPDDPLHSTSPGDVPDSVIFPEGTHGHLKVKLIARGSNAWEKVLIESTVLGGHIRMEGDVRIWVAESEYHRFDERVVLSEDSSEGHRTWTLRY